MTDKELKQHVQAALDWEPSIDTGDVGAAMDGGVVTLRGNVASYTEKIAAERRRCGRTASRPSQTT